MKHWHPDRTEASQLPILAIRWLALVIGPLVWIAGLVWFAQAMLSA